MSLKKDEDSKNKIINFFYAKAKEEDWLEGLDLYELGRIENITEYNGLFNAQVTSFSNKNYDVRLRVREQEHTGILQWTECSCHKNRKYNLYCEHIIAFVLYLKKERSQLFEKLNAVSGHYEPIRSSNKNLFKLLSEETPPHGINPSLSVSHSLLNRVKGEIKKVQYKNNGSFEIEIIDPLRVSSYHTLSIDSLAGYLKNQTEKIAAFKVKSLTLHDNMYSLGIHIYENKKGNLVLEKSYSSNKGELTKNENGEIEPFEIFPIDANCYLGEKYLYHKKRGFFPLTSTKLSKDFTKLKTKEELSGEKIPSFFEETYELLQKKFLLWLNEDLRNKHRIKTANLDDLGFLKEEKGWFYLDPMYKADGETVSMAALIDSYQNGKNKFYKTENGWLKIPEFIKDNSWTLSKTGEKISLATNKLGLLRLEALTGKFDHLVGSKKTLFYQKSFSSTKENPHELKSEESSLNLRPYQKEGLKWLCWLHNNGIHGLLADDMGLGKTHQAMALLDLVQKKRKEKKTASSFLIICPTTVIDHWHNKIMHFSPHLDPQKHHGHKRSFCPDPKKETTTILTSYGVLLRDYKQLAEKTWDVIILDEAHYIKNHKTMTYKAVCLIESQFRLCLTGTPMENHLGELKNLFDFLVPGYLGSNQFFNQEFVNPITQKQDLGKEHLLQKLIYPLKLRRTKSEVLKDLPRKIEDLRYCSLSKEQSHLYQEILNQKVKPILQKIEKDENVPYLHIFTILQLLKQACNHPALIYKDENFEKYKSGKFELLKDLIKEAIGSRQKIVIFTQYLGMIRYIEKYCQKEKIESVSLTGASQNRGKIIAKFQEDPNIKIFIGSLLAGGMGIDLTAASVVIHYDRWWNPSKENQATDRVHRIGQKKSVQVFKLITKGTLEEKIDELIKKKAQDFNKFFEQDRTIFKSLSKEDIINLLS